MIILDGIPESFGTAIGAVFIIIPIIALVLLIYRFMKQRKKDRQ